MVDESEFSPSAEQHSEPLLFSGILFIVLGAVSMLASIISTISVVLVCGALLLTAGVLECVQIFKRRPNALLRVLSALVYFAAGGLMLFNPFAGAAGLTLVMASFFFGSGLVQVIYGIVYRKMVSMGFFLFSGTVDIVLAAILGLGWPLTSLWALGTFVGVSLFTTGIAWVALASRTREVEQRQGGKQERTPQAVA